MEPLSAYEIQELMDTLNKGAYPVPIGSIWSTDDNAQLYVVLHHANLPTDNGPTQCVVLQALPDGSAWIQPTEHFLNSNWHSIGFVWDRGINV